MAASILLPASAIGKGKQPRRESWAANADSRKADYIYMEAMRQNSLGNDDAFSNFCNAHAASTRPTHRPG